MANLELEGKTLGEKHQNYNKLFKEAITNSKIKLDPGDDFNTGDHDIENLLKIDVANEQRNVDYIIKVLKCEDMMYVSRALKNCTWLISNQQFAHIINPVYLKSELFPEMTSKAIYKLMKVIKLHLKDEKRAEQFFTHETNIKRALKWLPICSIEFINEQANKHDDKLELKLVRRLCVKSMRVLEIIGKPHEHNYMDVIILKDRRLTATKFLLRFDTARYLDVVEQQNSWICPEFGKRATNFLMKTCPTRIINNFEKYSNHVHFPTFVEYLKKENIIKEFLLKQAKTGNESASAKQFLQQYSNLKFLIDAMPENDRIRFVNDVFILKIHEDDEEIIEESEKEAMRKFYHLATSRTPEYMFYDFNTAFAQITKLIRTEPKIHVKIKNVELLIKCADHNIENIQKILKYYDEKHSNDSDDLKQHFLSEILPRIHVTNCYQNTWILLEKLFVSLGVYNTSNETPIYITGFIILYKLIHKQTIPETIENKFFEALSKEETDPDGVCHYIMNKRRKVISCRKNHIFLNCRKYLNDQEQETLFNYLLSRKIIEINNLKFTNEIEFKKAVDSLKFILDLLKDWNKQLSDYPWILEKIKEYAETKKCTYIKTNLSDIYNCNKSWKRIVFEVSADICPSELVYINMLKHDYELFSRYITEIEALSYNNAKAAPKLLLNKLRVYWPISHAPRLTNMYLEKLNQIELHKAIITGLCALLPRQQLLNLIQKYAPTEAKINNINEIELSIQKQIALQMHIARPPPRPEEVLLFAKGDYLKFALPSLLAIFNNMSAIKVRKNVLKLLDAPVSIQKHGIPLAQAKLNTDEVKEVYSDIWMRTNNATIRTRIFKFTFELLRKETDPIKAQDTWQCLSNFIDNLTNNENKSIYELLAKEEIMNQLAPNIRPQYLMKTLKFLNQLLPELNAQDRNTYKYRVEKLTQRIRELIQYLPSEFVLDILSRFINETFMENKIKDGHCNRPVDMIKIMTAYVLCNSSDKTREEKYYDFFVPFFQSCLTVWDKTIKKHDFFIRKNIDAYLNDFALDLKDYVFVNNQPFPIDIYEDIKERLAKLPISENYVLITKWILFVELAKIMNSNKLQNWDETIKRAAPAFGMKCLEMLEIDVKQYFPCIYALFSTALHGTVHSLMINEKYTVYKCLLINREFVQGYLAVLKLLPNDNRDENLELQKIRKMLYDHPSDEVKMFCKHKFTNTLE